jgi:hypothetical protein
MGNCRVNRVLRIIDACLSRLGQHNSAILSFQVCWYDFWVGFYYARTTGRLYICPLPFCAIKIQLRNPWVPCEKCGKQPPMRWFSGDGVHRYIDAEGQSYYAHLRVCEACYQQFLSGKGERDGQGNGD